MAAKPRLMMRKGVWYVVKLWSPHSYGCGIGRKFAEVLAKGKTPEEAWNAYSGSFEVIVAESERIVWSEVVRVGKKVLPVIIALVVGIVIGGGHG